ncbi:hypothetical protein [Methylobacterium sp. J-090]|uniref:hypothetical protein n=1 Tax=Methylobacterium sp. J-090 TaxID=2836666 RepID=UPI001FBBCA64|nr:hypothetical protein [Methylobacterium sp. J-090]MCJ2079882.1 hypothetical protein [Methylobacterium sp. J-090]
MFHAAMKAAIEDARTLAQMDELSRQVWQGHGSGVLGDNKAQALAERLHGRRMAIREGIRPVGIPAGRASLFPPRRHVASPDKVASRDRRRLLACSGPMPPALAARFTTGQIAVLRIVADEVTAKGVCGLCIDAIAARAGVCRRLAQAAIRLAEGDGLLTIEERRHEGRKNSPNLVRIISREWQAWMRRGGSQKRNGFAIALPETGDLAKADGSSAPSHQSGIGCKRIHPTDKGIITGTIRLVEPSKKLPERQSRTRP